MKKSLKYQYFIPRPNRIYRKNIFGEVEIMFLKTSPSLNKKVEKNIWYKTVPWNEKNDPLILKEISEEAASKLSKIDE